MTKEKFLKVYANLPETERKEIIAIINNEPYTWARAYDEIMGKTKLGEKILEKLGRMGLI